MRGLGVVGMLAAAAIVLVLMVIVGRSLSASSGTGEGSAVKTGAQKAYEDMKDDKDAPLDDPKEEMREALKGG